MRLWHQHLIHFLPRQQLQGQHSECCGLRGNGWERKHSIVDYIFNYPIEYLAAYHEIVIRELLGRQHFPDPIWLDYHYRGLKCESLTLVRNYKLNNPIYLEHNDDYMYKCLENLKRKNIIIKNMDYSKYGAESMLCDKEDLI